MYSRKKLAAEIDQATTSLEAFTQKPVYLFRPPIGYMNPSIARVLRKRKMRIIGWSVRSYDSFKSKEQL